MQIESNLICVKGQTLNFAQFWHAVLQKTFPLSKINEHLLQNFASFLKKKHTIKHSQRVNLKLNFYAMESCQSECTFDPQTFLYSFLFFASFHNTRNTN